MPAPTLAALSADDVQTWAVKPHDHVAGAARPFDEAVDTGQMIGMSHRGDIGLGLTGIAQGEGVHVMVKPFQELVSDRILNQQARPSQTNLARIVVLPGSTMSRSVEVCVVEHDERCLSAEFE